MSSMTLSWQRSSETDYPSTEREQSVGNVRTLPKFISGSCAIIAFK
jgi:hypothetical protein